MTVRKSLPNWRAHALYNFECDGQHYIGGVGRFADGSLAEVFYKRPQGRHRKRGQRSGCSDHRIAGPSTRLPRRSASPCP